MEHRPPIVHFTEALRSTESPRRFNQLRERLFPNVQVLRLDYEAKGEKGKVFVFFSKEAPREQRYVVKFNPLGVTDPLIDGVNKECRILEEVHNKLPSIVPEPLFCSTDVEKRIVGTAFFVMTFVDGRIFRTVGEILRAKGDVVQMHVAAVQKLAEVHGKVLGHRVMVEHEDTEPYWQEVVDSCKQKYRSTVGWWRWLLGRDPESYLFSNIAGGRKPRSKRVSVVHGSLGIENFVFNEEMTEVHAILHWKYEKNGDGLMDIASLLLPFMDIGNYAVERPVQLVYSATDADVSRVVTAYRHSLAKGFNNEELEFAKAVCCLRQICAVKRGIYDGFRNSELGGFPEVTDNPDTVINLLHRHGEESYRAFRC